MIVLTPRTVQHSPDCLRRLAITVLQSEESIVVLDAALEAFAKLAPPQAKVAMHFFTAC
jgi:hypothetical protein